MIRTLIFALPMAIGLITSPAPERSRPESADHAPADSVPFLRRDTLFFRDRTETADGFTVTTKVYVDPDPRSETRRRLLRNASPETIDRADLAEKLRNLRRKHPGRFSRRNPGSLSATWLPLISVKGTLYIDGLGYPVNLTDSLFIEQTQDGLWPSIYTRFEAPEAGHLRFGTNSSYPPETDRAWDFYLIDPQRRIAVLAEHIDPDRTRYRLLADAVRESDFDLLAWDCTELPHGGEVPRDTLDFVRLIGKHYPVKP